MNDTSKQARAIEDAFIALENRAEILTQLQISGAEASTQISFKELWQAAQEPVAQAARIRQIMSNADARRQFEALLKRLERGHMGQQAAAGTQEMTHRHGETFDLNLIMSTRGDGAYVRVIFHQPPDTPLPRHLYYKSANGYHFLEMAPVYERVMQILIESHDQFFDIYQDPSTEFWVK